MKRILNIPIIEVVKDIKFVMKKTSLMLVWVCLQVHHCPYFLSTSMVSHQHQAT